ncbi:MAG: hypothetical protein ACPG52_04985 [Cognaticolwellia sp.]|tara:strand:- start:5981 stop:6583 length:603 start_codon:yes stop_codon:yes gene_type:complete
MAAFLRNKTKKKITSVKIHPMAKDLLSLIEALNLSIKPQQLSDQLITLIEETIKLEGVLDIETGEFLIFSPLFDLKVTSKTLEQMLNKNTITHRKEVMSDCEIEMIIWGDFFKNISTSIRFVDDIAIIQPALKNILPNHICQSFFGTKHLTQYNFCDLLNVDRGLITRAAAKIPPSYIKTIKSTSATFIPTHGLGKDDND